MREHFATTPLPASALELERLIFQAFLETTLQALNVPSQVYIKEVDHGGMPGGGISTEFWQETVLPLVERYESALYAQIAGQCQLT